MIKAGLRKINVAYARISIADICEKLKLEDKQDAEYIVAKAIRDGVIDATLDHAAQELRSNENQVCLFVSASLPRCLAASLPLCLSASLSRCLAASLLRCLSASLPLCLSAPLPLCLSAPLPLCLWLFLCD